MSKSGRGALSVLIPLLAIIACIIPGITAPNTTSISTAAAQTVVAGFTQNALPAILPTAFEMPISTDTPQSPTFTPTQTLTATLSSTFTPLVPQISVSVPTNCRNGPGKVYGLEGALLVGEIAQIHGRDPTGKYWYIPNPNKKGQFCWVWGEYANLSGNTGFLPVYTPPPTPTPTLTPTPAPVFEAEYSSLDTCTGWWVEFILRNTGSVRFQSAGIIVKDTVTKVTLSNLTDGFVDVNGCLTTNTRDALGPKKTTIISAPAFTYDPTGHKIVATITLCSNAGQDGTCVTRKIKFTP